MRELQKLTGIKASIVSTTINRLRTRGALIYIEGWEMQDSGKREQWVAKWHFGKPSKMDVPRPPPRANSVYCRKYYARRKTMTRAVSVWAWCSNPVEKRT